MITTLPAKRIGALVLVAFVLLGVTLIAFALARYILLHPDLQAHIASIGYVGVGIIAAITSLNVIIPIPAVTFTPVFTAAGLALPQIVVALALGTLAADFISHRLGRWGSGAITAAYPRLVTRLTQLYEKKRSWLLPVVFLYASFVPIPNEALVVPLAILGIKWRFLLVPLLIGNVINQAIYAVGIQTIFDWLL
jgi:hypothetical protein